MITKGIRGIINMLKPSITNQVIKVVAYVTVGLSVIVALLTTTYLEYTDLDSMRWLISFLVFASGGFSSLFLFAISEGLSRLQEIEYNSERTYKSVERSIYKPKQKASS